MQQSSARKEGRAGASAHVGVRRYGGVVARRRAGAHMSAACTVGLRLAWMRRLGSTGSVDGALRAQPQGAGEAPSPRSAPHSQAVCPRKAAELHVCPAEGCSKRLTASGSVVCPGCRRRVCLKHRYEDSGRVPCAQASGGQVWVCCMLCDVVEMLQPQKRRDE